MNFTPIEPVVEETFTKWYNPLDVDQRVDVFGDNASRPTRYIIPAKGERLIPSRFDRAIHTVHGQVIVGGLAPQLVNRSTNAEEHLAPALDTEGEKRRLAEEALFVADANRKAAEQAQVIAANRMAKATPSSTKNEK